MSVRDNSSLANNIPAKASTTKKYCSIVKNSNNNTDPRMVAVIGCINRPKAANDALILGIA